MTRLQFCVDLLPTVTALTVIALSGVAVAAEAAGSTGVIGPTGAVTTDEPAFVSPTTLVAVVAAFLLGLLIVAVVRRADR